MNKIKDSFSKIKASDEFKDKLLRELQANPIKLTKPTKKTYYKSYVAVASVLFVLLGILSYKLIINNSERGTTSFGNIAYAPKEEPSTDNESTNEIIKSKNDTNISPKLPEHEILSDTTENATLEKIEISKNNILENTDTITTVQKSEDSINKNSEPEKVVSAKSPISDNIVNSNNIVNSDSVENSPNVLMYSMKGATDENISLNASAASIYVPKIQLSTNKTIKNRKMLPLIVYKGNIYIYMPIDISAKNTANLLGRRLGTTKNNLDEWSTQSDYSNEFASNIGITNVYAINGYDEDFRIMTNTITNDGTSHPEFYECLNDITIKNGADIIERLKLQGNIDQAKFQNYSDWNNGTGHFYTINNLKLLNSFLDQMNNATPYLPEDIEASLDDYRNDNECKEIYLDLKDGLKNIPLVIFKNGYVSYGYPRIYLKIDSNFTEEFFNSLDVMKIN